LEIARKDDTMAKETAVILNAMYDIITTSKNLEEAYELFLRLSNTENPNYPTKYDNPNDITKK